MPTRYEVLGAIAQHMLAVDRSHPLRAGIDGVTASGKTTLADELAEVLSGSGRQVVRATIDDFHNPPAIRYVRGRLSPEGYYLDTFDYGSIRSLLLEPLGPDGSRLYRAGSFGQPDGSPKAFEEHVADEDASLLVDGIFLFRPELHDCWDYRVFLQVDQRIATERGIARDAAWMGGAEVAQEHYERRYLPGERLYLEAVQPAGIADAVVTNDAFDAPSVRFRQ